MKLRFLYILLVILGLSLNTDCLFSDDHEISSEMSEESFNKNDDEIKECEEKPVSLLTQGIDKLVEWNQKYIIPLSYAYICYDYSKNIYGMIKDVWSVQVTSETIYPNYSGDNPIYQKLVSKVAEVGQKVGTMPRSIIITKNSPDLDGASDLRDIIVSESFFENKSENEVDYIIAHELSHIKKYHVIFRLIPAIKPWLFIAILSRF